MPLKVSELAKEVRHMVVVVDKDDPEAVVNIKYRPGAFTLEVADKLKALAAEEVQVEAVAILLEPVLLEWDLLDEDGAPLPVTREGLAKVPLLFLAQVVDDMQMDNQPSRDEGKDSAVISQQTVERVPSLSGIS